MTYPVTPKTKRWLVDMLVRYYIKAAYCYYRVPDIYLWDSDIFTKHLAHWQGQMELISTILFFELGVDTENLLTDAMRKASQQRDDVRENVIQTEEEYDSVLGRAGRLMDALPDSKKEVELDHLVRLIEEYENISCDAADTD